MRSSVVLCGDCFISFLTSCVPKNVETTIILFKYNFNLVCVLRIIILFFPFFMKQHVTQTISNQHYIGMIIMITNGNGKKSPLIYCLSSD